MKIPNSRAVGCAILAAALYALSSPFSKLLLSAIGAVMLSGLLYLGAGIGMLPFMLIRKKRGAEGFQRGDTPYIIGMILLDIAAPILLLLGLTHTGAGAVSLLNNFEIVATTLLALLFFREAVPGRLWAAILFILAACTLLSLEEGGELRFSMGSVLVLLASCCWGLENNCTRRLSERDPCAVVTVKGLCSGGGALVIALCLGEALPKVSLLLPALLLGFVAYGLSIFFYVTAQRTLGAARTSAFYAVAPFIGVLFSFLIFRDKPGLLFLAGFLLMLVGTYFAAIPARKERKTT